MNGSRRNFLALAAGAPLALLAASRTRAADAPACYYPATLPFTQKNRRRSLGYVEISTDAKKHCGACSFFTASTASGCGTCQLLSGGPVRADAVCNSFAAKPQA
ncbi:MAG: high-potential iron-sulfur protein [Novosphingobium sp.]